MATAAGYPLDWLSPGATLNIRHTCCSCCIVIHKICCTHACSAHMLYSAARGMPKAGLVMGGVGHEGCTVWPLQALWHTGSYCQLAALVGSPLHVYAERQLCQKLHILRAMEAHQSADVVRGDS